MRLMSTTHHNLYVLKMSFGGRKTNLSVNQVIVKNMLFLGCHQNFFTSYKKDVIMLNLPETFLRPLFEVVLKMYKMS